MLSEKEKKPSGLVRQETRTRETEPERRVVRETEPTAAETVRFKRLFCYLVKHHSNFFAEAEITAFTS